MAATVHTIHIGIKAGTNMEVAIDKVMNNLISNIDNGKQTFTQFITEAAKSMAQQEAMLNQWKGDLWKGIYSRINKKSGIGRVLIRSDQVQKAIMNEFGAEDISEYKNIPYSVLPDQKLRAWARDKAPQWADKPFILIGKPNTRSHVIKGKSQNRFWGITAGRINANMDKFFGRYLEQIIEKS